MQRNGAVQARPRARPLTTLASGGLALYAPDEPGMQSHTTVLPGRP
ncbi:hypothetical protein JCM18899A_38900 [Nocardioides sp. AN3]